MSLSNLEMQLFERLAFSSELIKTINTERQNLRRVLQFAVDLIDSTCDLKNHRLGWLEEARRLQQPPLSTDIRVQDSRQTFIPEMWDLIQNLANAYDDDKPSHDLASTLYELRCIAIHLINKVEGGEQ